MSSFYSDLANVATRLLTDKGQQVTVTRPVTSSHNPATGVVTSGTSTTFTGFGAAFNYNKSEVDGTLVQHGDIRFMIDASGGLPEINDLVTIDSDSYRVMSVINTSPAGTSVKYELQLRK